jgi:hypothetical protein
MSSAIQSTRSGVLWRWIFVGAAVGVASCAIVLALTWPFTQTVVTKTFQDRFARDVNIRKFRSTTSPGSERQTFPLTNSTSGKTLTIGEITTDGAVLEFMSERPAESRFTLRIDHLTLDQVGESDPVTFQFGPWHDGDPASTKLSGSYTYEHAKLGVFAGIAGTLS